MYCQVCGKEILDEAVICTNCGCMVNKIAKEQKSLEPVNTDNKSYTSIILGIIGIVSAWIFALAGHITSIIGIVFGIQEYKKSDKITGLVLSIIGEICSIISSVIGAVVMSNIL